MGSYYQTLVERAVRHWFPNTEVLSDYRPEWLQGMEIDLYVPSVRLAIEVQGHQHYLYIPEMHKSIDDFHSQRRRDARKRDLVRLQGITLITLRYPRRKRIQFGVLAKMIRRNLPGMVMKRLPDDLIKEWKGYKRIQARIAKRSPSFKVKRSGIVWTGASDFQTVPKDTYSRVT